MVGRIVLTDALAYKAKHDERGKGCRISEEPTSPRAAESARWRLADETLARASEREREITEDLEEVTEAIGGELVGLEFKFKSREGIVEKIGRQRRKYGDFLESDEEAAGTIRDVLRYTFMGETESHADDVEATLAGLRARGYEVGSGTSAGE